MSIYLKIPDITGDVQAKDYKDWIQIHSVDFAGINNPAQMLIGRRMDRMLDQPQFAEATLLKSLDKSSSGLFAAGTTAKVFSEIEIHYLASGNPPFTYAKLKLINATLTHYSEIHDNGSSYPEEVIRFAYTRIERTYIPRDAKNTTQTPLIAGYDLATASKL